MSKISAALAAPYWMELIRCDSGSETRNSRNSRPSSDRKCALGQTLRVASLVDDRLIDEGAYEPSVMDPRSETLSHENCGEILLGIDPENSTR